MKALCTVRREIFDPFPGLLVELQDLTPRTAWGDPLFSQKRVITADGNVVSERQYLRDLRNLTDFIRIYQPHRERMLAALRLVLGQAPLAGDGEEPHE